MMGIIRSAVIGFGLLTVVYLIVAMYSRSVRREKLEKKFDKGDVEGDRDTYIADGMLAYEKGLKRRLVWLVYIVPAVIVISTVYLVNYQ